MTAEEAIYTLKNAAFLGTEEALKKDNDAVEISIEAFKKQERMKCKNCMFCQSGYCEKYDDLIPFGCFDDDWENWFCADWSEVEK